MLGDPVDGAEPVDVGLDQVPANSITHPKCPLEVHSSAHFVLAEPGAPQRGVDHVNPEAAAGQGLYRQARSVHGDTFARLHTGVTRLELQIETAACPPDLEHG